MRLARLDLISWGHFARASLDLSAPGVHLVYGPNEAGKSTARRAITALLFGVPRGTPDAFLLPKATDARVGGRVLGDGGEALEIVRRGGQKNTLLTPRDEVLSEEPLARLVGVAEATFTAVFSMDHDTLRQGAEAVLRVGGDVGASLAAAALGDARLSTAAARLRGREGELYNPAPNARKSQLHEALRAYKEARQRVDDAESDPAAYDQQRRHARERRDAHEAALQRLAASKRQRLRLEEVQRARPVVRERDAVEARLAVLAHVPLLRGGLEQEHSSIAQDRRQAEGGLEVVAARRELLRARAASRLPVAQQPLAWLEPLRSGLARDEPRSARLRRVAALLEEQGAALASAEPVLVAWLDDAEAARQLLGGRASTLRHLAAAREARRLHAHAAQRAAALREQRAEEDPARVAALERGLAALDTASLLEARASAALRGPRRGGAPARRPRARGRRAPRGALRARHLPRGGPRARSAGRPRARCQRRGAALAGAPARARDLGRARARRRAQRGGGRARPAARVAGRALRGRPRVRAGAPRRRHLGARRRRRAAPRAHRGPGRGARRR